MPRDNYKVYVLQLRPEAAEDYRVRMRNPEADLSLPCFYVGLTSKTIEARIREHEMGIRASPFVQEYFRCDRSVEVSSFLNPMTYPMARYTEMLLVEYLRSMRFPVVGGPLTVPDEAQLDWTINTSIKSTFLINPNRPCGATDGMKYFIQRNPDVSGRPWWVYVKNEAVTTPADDAHEELVSLVLTLKREMGAELGGGSFFLNEHSQVIASANPPLGWNANSVYLVGVNETGDVLRYRKPLTFGDGIMDSSAMPAEGDIWTGPAVGVRYAFNDALPDEKMVCFKFERKGPRLFLSHDLEERGLTFGLELARFNDALHRVMDFGGGRFYVNEQGRAFSARSCEFIAQVPLESWFRALDHSCHASYPEMLPLEQFTTAQPRIAAAVMALAARKLAVGANSR